MKISIHNAIVSSASLLILAACGSSGGGPSGAGGSGGAAGHPSASGGVGGEGGRATGGAGGMAGADAGVAAVVATWKENGVARAATSSLAIRNIGTSFDFLEVLLTDLSASATVSFVVSNMGTLDATAHCGIQDGGVEIASFAYDNRPVPSGETCTITLTFMTGADGHPHVAGTFEAMLPGDGGATTLTDGQFDVPLTQNGG